MLYTGYIGVGNCKEFEELWKIWKKGEKTTKINVNNGHSLPSKQKSVAFLSLRICKLTGSTVLRRFLKFLSFLCAIYLILNINLGFANRLSIVRDTEIESIIVNYVTPVFRAARLDPDSIQIFIVKDDSLNAFVMNGQKIFIHSGLLIESESAEEIIGVIAHETGHIAGGHLSRRRNALSNFSISNFLSFALAGAATIATKRSDVGTALVGVGQTIGQRSFFSYNRAQESAADYAAVRFLEKAGISALGLLNFMVRIREQESINLNFAQ